MKYRGNLTHILLVALFLLTAVAKAQTIVNVQSYGAKGDGFTDDKKALDKAIDALASGGVLYFPAGRYVLGKNSDNGIKISSLHHIAIKGDGPQSKILYYYSSYKDGSSGAGQAALTLSNVKQAEISKISIQGMAEIPNPSYSYSSETSGLLIDHSENIKIENINVMGLTGYGIFVTSTQAGQPSRNITITNSRSGQNRVTGIMGANVDALLVSETILDSNGQIGDPATGYGFAGHSKSWPGYPANVTLLNNEAFRNMRKGLDFHAGVNLNIIGNSVYENGLYGIDVEGPGLGGKIVIQNNHIFSMGSHIAEMLQVRNDHPIVQANYTAQICGICIFYMKKMRSDLPDKEILVEGNVLENITQFSEEKGSGYYGVFPFGLANFDGANRDQKASFSFVGNKVINSDFSSLFLQGWSGDGRAGRFDFKFNNNQIEFSGVTSFTQVFFYDAKTVEFKDNIFTIQKKQVISLEPALGMTNEERIAQVKYKTTNIPALYSNTLLAEKLQTSPNSIAAYATGFLRPQFNLNNNKVVFK